MEGDGCHFDRLHRWSTFMLCSRPRDRSRLCATVLSFMDRKVKAKDSVASTQSFLLRIISSHLASASELGKELKQ
jgi:hypothetical protein